MVFFFLLNKSITRKGSRTHHPKKIHPNPKPTLQSPQTNSNRGQYCCVLWLDRVRQRNVDGLGAVAVGGEGTAGGSNGSCWGDSDDRGKAGLSTQPVGSTSVSPGCRLLHADLPPHACSLSGLRGQPPLVPPQGLPPLAPSSLHYFRGVTEGRRREYFPDGFFPVVIGLPGVGSFLCLCASLSLLCI